MATEATRLGLVIRSTPAGLVLPLGTGIVELDDYKGTDLEEWPADLRVQQFPRPSSAAGPYAAVPARR